MDKRAAILCFLLFLVTGINSPGQTDRLAKLDEYLSSYCNRYPREDIYIHTDRETYISGEELWFSVYCTERYTGRPSRLSTVAYFEILNYENRPVIRKKVLLEDGHGPGNVTLPDTLGSGLYTIRAYTGWMKNFLPENCFMKEIRLWNALSSKPPHKAATDPFIGARTPFSEEGFSIVIEENGKDNIDLRIDGGGKTGDYFVFIETRGKKDYSGLFTLKETGAVIPVPRQRLQAGINHITLFDAGGRPVAERSVFNPGNSGSGFITVPDSSGTREPVTAEIELPGHSMVSMSVALNEFDNFPGIDDYMIFGSEYGNDIFRYLDPKITLAGQKELIDSLLATRASAWINWNHILTEDKPLLRFKPETGVHFLNGTLLNSSPGDMVIMSIPGRMASFRYAVTDSAGNFSFSLPADLHYRDIVIQRENPASKGIIKLVSPFSEDFPEPGALPDTAALILPEKLSINYQVSRIYGLSFINEAAGLLPLPPGNRFYGKPDIELIMADYIKLPVMEEVFFEILPGTFMKKKRTGYEITIADPVTNTILPVPPSLFVDGVRIDNADIIAGMDPENVEQIDVVLEKHVIGDYLFHGIVNVITKAADLSSIELPDYILRTRYRSIDPVSSFRDQEHNGQFSQNSRIPDFRNTLYWNPSAAIAGEKLRSSFRAPDRSGDYLIRIEGMTTEGKFFSVKKNITIR